MGRLVISKSKDPIIAACIYLACRMENYPRTLDEVSFATGVDVKLVSKMQQVIARRLQLSIGRLRPQHLVNRFATRVNCSHCVSNLAAELCEKLTRLELLETLPPQLVAAGTLVVAALVEGASINIDMLTAVTLVTVPSIKTVYRQLLPVLPMLSAGHSNIATTTTTSVPPSGNSFLAVRIKTLPQSLDKCLQDGTLVVIEQKPEKGTEVSRVVSAEKTASGGQQQRASEDSSLADLVYEISAPIRVTVGPPPTLAAAVSALSPSNSLQNLASELASAYVSCCSSNTSGFGDGECSGGGGGGDHRRRAGTVDHGKDSRSEQSRPTECKDVCKRERSVVDVADTAFSSLIVDGLHGDIDIDQLGHTQKTRRVEATNG